MSKMAVIYWSGTGNTQAMAEAVAQGGRDAGAEVDLLSVSETDAAGAAGYPLLALGCSAMGDEVLEEGEFEPFFAALEGQLSGRPVALFGSYGWGDGQWMRDWVQRARDAGASVVGGEGLIANEAPGEDDLAACRKLGADLAAMG